MDKPRHQWLRLAAVALGLFALGIAQAGEFAHDGSAEVFLRSIYGNAYTGKGAKGINLSTLARLDRYFVPELARKIDADGHVAAKRGDVGALDGDAFIGAQDFDIAAFDVVATQSDAADATGTVKFSNGGEARTVVVTLKRLKSGWRIADVDWGTSGRLSALFAPTN